MDTTVQRLGVEFFAKVDGESFTALKNIIADIDLKLKALSRVTLGDAIQQGLSGLLTVGTKATRNIGGISKELRGLGVMAGMGDEQIKGLNLRLADLDKAHRLLGERANILRGLYNGLSRESSNYEKASRGLNAQLEKTLFAQQAIKKQIGQITGVQFQAGIDKESVKAIETTIRAVNEQIRRLGKPSDTKKVELPSPKNIEGITKNLKDVGVVAGMSFDQVKNLGLGLAELERVHKLLSDRAGILRTTYNGLNRESAGYEKTSRELNKRLEETVSTQVSVRRQIDLVKGSFADAGRAVTRWGDGFISMLKSQAAWLAGGAILFGTIYKIQDAFRGFISFEDRLNRMRIIGHATTEEMNELKKSMLSLAEAAGQAPGELAEAAFYLVKYGLSIEQVNKALPALVRLTEVAGGSIESNAKGIISIMNAYNISYNEAEKVTNAFNVALNQSALEMSDLSSIISTVASSAARFDQPIEQLLGLAGAMSNLGVQSSTIGTSLRQLFSVLAQAEQPTKRFHDNIIKKLQDHEIAVSELNPAYKDIVSILNTLDKAGITTLDLFRALEIRIAGNTATMINALPRLADLVEAIKTENNLMSQFAETTTSAKKALDSLNSTLTTTLIKLLSGSDRGLANFAKVIQRVLQVVGYLSEGVQGVVIRLGLLGAGIAMLLVKLKLLQQEMIVVNTLMGLSPWGRWLIVIGAVISGLGLLTQAHRKLAQDHKEDYEQRRKQIEFIENQIKLNDDLIKAGVLEKDMLIAKNAVLREELELKQKLAEKDRQAILRQGEQVIRRVKESPSVDLLSAGAGLSLGPWDELPEDLSYSQTYEIIKKDARKWDSLYDALMAMRDEDKKKYKGLAEILNLVKQQQTKVSIKTVPAKKIDIDVEHREKMQALADETALILRQAEAYGEVDRIANEMFDAMTKYRRLSDKDVNTEDEKNRLAEERLSTWNKILQQAIQLGRAVDDANKNDAEYNERLQSLKNSYGILKDNLEGVLRLEAEKAELERQSVSIARKLQSLKITPDERKELEIKQQELLNSLEEKNIAIESERYKVLIDAYSLQKDQLDRILQMRQQEVDLNGTLTDQEKDYQKALLERQMIETKILYINKLIAEAEGKRLSVDTVKRLQDELNRLLQSLGMQDKLIRNLEDRQDDWLRGFKDYIQDAKTTWKDFVYDMEYQFSKGVGAMISGWGKWVTYQGSQAKEELRSQRDESLKDAQVRYGEEKQSLLDMLNAGQLTYAQYYEKLSDLDKNYRQEIHSAQSRYEDQVRKSMLTVGALWERFWQKMIDLAIESFAKMAMEKMKFDAIFKSLGTFAGGLFGAGSTPQSGTQLPASGGSAFAHSGGLVSDIITGIKKFHDGGFNQNEVLIKALKSEYIMRPQAVGSLGVNSLDYMNRTGQVPQREIRIINVVDPSTIPTLSPDDVINIISFDVARRGTTYNTLNKGR